MTTKARIGRASEVTLDGAISAKIPGMTSKAGDQQPFILQMGVVALSTTAQSGAKVVVPFDATIVGGIVTQPAAATATGQTAQIGTATATNAILSAFALATTAGVQNFTTSLVTATLSQGAILQFVAPIGLATGNVDCGAALIIVPRN